MIDRYINNCEGRMKADDASNALFKESMSLIAHK